MSYQSPVALLQPEQIEYFSPADFKKIRSELLLQFQFSVDPSVMIQDRPYVKDDVLQLMEEFQEDPELHLYIFKDKPLLNFLENGDMGFFNDAAHQFNEQRYQLPANVHPLIVDALDENLPKWTQPIDNATTLLFKGVQKVLQSFDPSLQEKAYGSTFVEIQGVIGVLERDFKEPFEKPGGYGVSPQVEGIVNREFLEYFKYLPASFDKLRYDYCNWCNNKVVYPFVSRQEKFGRFHRNTLHVIKEAAYIASTAVMKEANLGISATINNFLLEGGAVRSRSPLGIIWIIILGLVFLFRIGSVCNRQSDRQNSRNAYKTYNNNQQQYNQGVPAYVPLPGSSKKSQVAVMPGRYNGSAHRQQPKPTLVKTTTTGDQVTLKYAVDIFPTRTDVLQNYILKSLLKKYSGQQKKINLQFSRKGLPEVVFSHMLQVQISSTGVIENVYHKNMTIALDKVEPVANATYKYKGFITQMDTAGNILNQDTISFTKVLNSQRIQRMYNGRRIEAGNNNTSEERNMETRSLTVSHNLGRLKELPQLGFSKSMELYFYSFETKKDSLDKLTSKCGQLSYEPVELYSLLSSAADSIVYYGVLTDMYDIKYMVNSRTGRVMGIQMAIADRKSGPYIERLEAYYVKED